MRFKGSNSYGHSRAVHIRSSGTRESLYPRVGFIVTNLSRPAERVARSTTAAARRSNGSREGKYALRWTRLSCRAFRHNAVRLQLYALAYNLGQLPALAGPARGDQVTGR